MTSGMKANQAEMPLLLLPPHNAVHLPGRLAADRSAGIQAIAGLLTLPIWAETAPGIQIHAATAVFKTTAGICSRICRADMKIDVTLLLTPGPRAAANLPERRLRRIGQDGPTCPIKPTIRAACHRRISSGFVRLQCDAEIIPAGRSGGFQRCQQGCCACNCGGQEQSSGPAGTDAEQNRLQQFVRCCGSYKPERRTRQDCRQTLLQHEPGDT
jgi:hypothetical protein